EAQVAFSHSRIWATVMTGSGIVFEFLQVSFAKLKCAMRVASPVPNSFGRRGNRPKWRPLIEFRTHKRRESCTEYSGTTKKSGGTVRIKQTLRLTTPPVISGRLTCP